jgi:hypothetical protein
MLPPLANDLHSWFTWITASSANFAAQFLGQLDIVQDYITTYQSRLLQAYKTAKGALNCHQIPFNPADAGLFFLIDLGEWVSYFEGPDSAADSNETREIQLCKWLVDGGVFLNPGQVHTHANEYAFGEKMLTSWYQVCVL